MQVSTRSGPAPLRLAENPILSPQDVPPSRPDLEVVSAFNAAAVRYEDQVLLLLRVAERPRAGVPPGPDAHLLDLSGAYPTPLPMVPGTRPEELVGLAYLDTTRHPPSVQVGYVRRDLPGLDLSDPRTIIYRGRQFLSVLSHLRVARSNDGVHFTVDPEPAITPQTELEEYGCEDPRITFLDDTYYITYVSVGRLGITTSLAATRDFQTFERLGVIFLPDHKDVVIMPERCRDRYAALTRPMPYSFGRVHGIWVSFSDNLVDWGEHYPVALPRRGMWDEVRLGAGTVPIRVPEGWLELYHGVDRTNRYCMGALLLDADEPWKVLARSPEPLLAPEMPFEVEGFYGNVVFPSGAIPLDDSGRWIRVYYGAADTVVAAADFEVEAILASLR